jgi:hypothetical protein
LNNTIIKVRSSSGKKFHVMKLLIK